MEEALTKALAKQPLTIDYPEYETTDNFSQWLAGYRAKIQGAYGLDPGQVEEINAQVVKSIAGMLSVGSALNAYNCLDPADKVDYERLVSRLTEEYSDPHEKCRFNENIRFNIRRKGQTLKDFMEEIKRDLGRYSDLPDERYDSAGASHPNREKEKEGVRRFQAGMRTKEGKKDKELKRHLKYHLVDSKELTWENALKLALNWEVAYGTGTLVVEEEVEKDESLGSVEVKAMAVKPKREWTERRSEESEEDVAFTASLLDQVQENRRRIEKLELGQEKMAASVEAMGVTVVELSSKMDSIFGWLESCGGDGQEGGEEEAELSEG